MYVVEHSSNTSIWNSRTYTVFSFHFIIIFNMKKNINVNLFLQGEGGRKSGGHGGRRGLTSASFNESSQSGSRIVSNRYV